MNNIQNDEIEKVHVTLYSEDIYEYFCELFDREFITSIRDTLGNDVFGQLFYLPMYFSIRLGNICEMYNLQMEKIIDESLYESIELMVKAVYDIKNQMDAQKFSIESLQWALSHMENTEKK